MADTEDVVSTGTAEDASVVIEDPSVVAVYWLAGGKPLQPDNSTIRAWYKNDLGIDFAKCSEISSQ